MNALSAVRLLGSTLGLLASLSIAGVTRAQTRSGPIALRESRFIIGVERVTGAVGWSTRSAVETDFGRFERSRRGGQLHILGASGHAGDGRDALNFSSVPRVAFDYLTDAGLTVGGFISLLGSAGREELTVDDREQEDISFPDTMTALTGARLGYVLGLGRRAFFWPRIGVAYSAQGIFGSAGARQTIHSLQVTAEPTFVISPVSHVGFLIHPFFDWGVAGSIENSFVITGLPTQGSKGRYRAHAAGVTGGLVVFF